MSLLARQKRLTCHEWKTVSVGQAGLSSSEAERLCRLAARNAKQLKLPLEAILARRHNHVAAGQVCGVLSVPGVRLEILPKIDIDGDDGRATLIHMLNVAYDLRISAEELTTFSSQSHDLLEIVILSFARRLNATLRSGLPHRYLTETDDLAVLRGSLDVKRQFTKHAVRPDRLACRYDELSPNTPLNRVVAAAARLLSRLTGHAPTYAILSGALDRMEGVGISIAPLSERVSLDRTNTAWHGLYNMAKLLLVGASQSAGMGAHEGFALLFPMNDLFENYTAKLFRRSYGHQVRTQARSKFVTIEGLFNLKPDILVEMQDETLIVDTKWKSIDLSKDKADISEADVYQMLAYGHAYGGQGGETCLMLLYPARMGQGTKIHRKWNVAGSGFKLQIATLDLFSRKTRNCQIKSLVAPFEPDLHL